jgi:hypothetical protein
MLAFPNLSILLYATTQFSFGTANFVTNKIIHKIIHKNDLQSKRVTVRNIVLLKLMMA